MKPRPELIPGYRRILHGGDYNPDQWLHEPGVIEEDFRLMRLAGCNAFAVGIFAWAALEPEEGRYTLDWLDRIMDRMAAEGSRVILATPSGSKPAWLSYRYPEIRRVNVDGHREPHARRHNHCWQSPVYRRKVAEMNARLAGRYGRHPALGMWHVSNEYSGACYCDRCLARWHEWLRERYGTLERLNQAWWTAFWSHTFSEWNQIDPRDGSIDGMQLDWLRFNTWQIRDFYRWETAPLKQHAPHVPCTTNFMGGHGQIDYGRLADMVDLISDDQYPCYDAESPLLLSVVRDMSFRHELWRAAKPDRPWMLMESCPDTPQWKYPQRLKQPGLHRAEMLQALGNGAEGTCYFQWRKGRGGQEKLHGAVVDHAGHEQTRVFQTVAELGRLYERLGPVIGSQTRAQAALVFDWEVMWAFELSQGTYSRDRMYRHVALAHYRGLHDRAIPVDVIHSERDFSGYHLLIAPQLWMLKPGVAERLTRFVEQGGTLVGTHYTGACDETNRCFMGGWPSGGLDRVFGLVNEETDCLGPEMKAHVRFTADSPIQAGTEVEAGPVCALVQPRGAEVWATYQERFYAGTPALTVHRLGKGRAFYHAALLGEQGMDLFYGWLVRDLALAPALPGDLPRGVLVQRREKDGRVFLFVENFTSVPQKIVLPGDSARRMDTGLSLAGSLALGPWESTVIEMSAHNENASRAPGGARGTREGRGERLAPRADGPPPR